MIIPIREVVMIIRVFHARVRPEKRPAFKKVVEQLSIPHFRSRNGIVAIYPGQPLGANSNEFILVTVWKDPAALNERSNEDWVKTIIPEEALSLLEDMQVISYEAFGIPEQPLKPLFNSI